MEYKGKKLLVAFYAANRLTINNLLRRLNIDLDVRKNVIILAGLIGGFF